MGDNFGLNRWVSIILAIIPITAWILGIATRCKEGAILAAIVRIFFGVIIWIVDLILMCLNGHIWRCCVV